MPPPAEAAHNLPRMADTADTFFGKLNGPWHKRALQAFLVIVIAHWAEHLVQAWLVHSEVLHYGYAMIMLVGIGRCSAPDAARMRCSCALRPHPATT